MPRSAEDRWKDIEALRKRTDAMRKKNEEDRAELKKWEESIKEVPVELPMSTNNHEDALERQQEMLDALRADQKRRAAERVILARRAAEAHAAITPNMQAILDKMASEKANSGKNKVDGYKHKDVWLHIDEMARHKHEPYTMAMFLTKLNEDLPLYEYYELSVAMNKDEQPESDYGHWSGHGPVTGARASLRAHGSVVDSVFAKLP